MVYKGINSANSHSLVEKVSIIDHSDDSPIYTTPKLEICPLIE